MIQHLDRTPNGYYTGGRLLAWTIAPGPLSCSWNGDFSASQPNWQPVAGVGVPKWKRYFAIDFSDSSNLTFQSQAIELKKVINCVKQITGLDKVILVAHSMGGLASRYYLQSLSGLAYGNDVAKLVTIGTPHAGAISAALERILNPYSIASGELRPRSLALERINDPVSESYLLPDLPYVAIAALMFGSESDGIVSRHSQTLTDAYKSDELADKFNLAYQLNYVVNYTVYFTSWFGPLTWQVHTGETGNMSIMDIVKSEIEYPKAHQDVQATTGSFSNLTTTSVTINGSAFLRGYVSARYAFEWGYNDTVSNSTPLNFTTTTNSEIPFSARIAGLTPGSTISYRAKLTPTAGTPEYGDIRHVQIPTSTPGYLPAPTLTNPSNGVTGQPERPIFQWSAVANATSYRILAARNASDLPTDPDTAKCPACVIDLITIDTTIRPSGGALLANQTYYWIVHARNPDWSGLWSAVSSFSTEAAIVK